MTKIGMERGESEEAFGRWLLTNNSYQAGARDSTGEHSAQQPPATRKRSGSAVSLGIPGTWDVLLD